MMTNQPHQLRKTICQMRQERGWSRTELAQQLGLSPGSVADGERGQSHPLGRTLLRLAHLVGVTAEDMAPSLTEQHLPAGPR